MHFYCHSAHSRNTLKPQKPLKSTILTPTFSYKAEVKAAENASRWFERQQVLVSILPLLQMCKWGQLSTASASPGRAPKPSLAELHSGPYRARGWQKGWLSNPCFHNSICTITAGRHMRAGPSTTNIQEKNHHLPRMLQGFLLPIVGSQVTINQQAPGCYG